ncbi:MAG: hypothetical protein DWI01_08465, partial [Planctomycetota bacterium]
MVRLFGDGASGKPLTMRWGVLVLTALSALHQLPPVVADDQPLPGTSPLTIQRPLDEVMIEGIDRFLLRKTDEAKAIRRKEWTDGVAAAAGRDAFRAGAREKLCAILGVVDERVPGREMLLRGTAGAPIQIAATKDWTVLRVSFEALDDVTAEGIVLLPPLRDPRAW